MIRARLFLIGLILIGGCKQQAPAPPVRVVSEEERLEARIRPHFDNFTIFPSETGFRNLRKLDDGRVCGEVNMRDIRGDQLGFAVFLDPMEPDTTPVIVHPNQMPPSGYRVVADTCMNDVQRELLDRAIEDEQRAARLNANRAYEASRSAMMREQAGAGGVPRPYNPQPVWRPRYQPLPPPDRYRSSDYGSSRPTQQRPIRGLP